MVLNILFERESRSLIALAMSRATHAVFNQSKAFINKNLFKSDPALQRVVKKLIVPLDHLNNIGLVNGSAVMMNHAELAEKNVPVLRQYDAYGRRIDVVDYHPSYHALMKQGLESGAASYGFNNNAKPGSHIVRAALIYMQNQLEPGHCCPIVMTSAAVPVIRKNSSLHLTEKLCAQNYDPRDVPISEKSSITMGMSMTEKQGGSDVRANTTVAQFETSSPSGHKAFLLKGHKWFTSAPMSDAFLTLAKTRVDAPPSCFLVPRWRFDGTRNSGFKVMRLKQKCGDRSNASSEVEYDGAWGLLLGEESRGVKTIIEMVNCTRMDCTLGAAGGSRKALMLALNHAASRNAFGASLNAHPLMQNVLTDLCVEAEAHTLTAFHMAQLFSDFESKVISGGSDCDRAGELFRTAVSVAKYYVTKRQPNFVYECMEIMGGNGYVQDFQMESLFRQSPLNSIWEGSGNVMALDVLRAYKSLPLLLDSIAEPKGVDSSFDNYMKVIQKFLC